MNTVIYLVSHAETIDKKDIRNTFDNNELVSLEQII